MKEITLLNYMLRKLNSLNNNEKTNYSNKQHRPIGIGVQGLADTFMLLDIAFHSDEAKEINKNIFEKLPENHIIKFYLDKENNIIGAITLIIEQKIIHNGECVGHIEDFVVTEKEQHKGIGKALYIHLIKSLKDDGYRRILAGISLPNNKSVIFHEKLGFKKVGQLEKVGFNITVFDPKKSLKEFDYEKLRLNSSELIYIVSK